MCFIVIGCSSTSNGPSDPAGEPWLYLTVPGSGETGADVLRWKFGMSTPEVVLEDAALTNPPRSGRMVCLRWDGEGSSVLLVNNDGSNIEIVATSDERIRSAGISADGRFVHFLAAGIVGQDIVYQLWLKEVGGGQPMLLANSAGWEELAHWSPTSSQLAYIGSSSESGVSDSIVVYNASTGVRSVLTTMYRANPDATDGWSWNNDGTSIRFNYLSGSPQEPFPQLMSVDVTSGSVTAVEIGDEWIPGYAGNGASNSEVLLTGVRVDSLPNLSPSILRLSTEDGTVAEIKDFPSNSMPYYLNQAPSSNLISYSRVELPETGDPLLGRSPIEVVDGSTGVVTSIGVTGAKALWAR